MTIKEIEKEYADYGRDRFSPAKNTFISDDFKEWGRVVIVCERDSYGWIVKQVVRRSDGAELLNPEMSWHAYSRADAIDIAWEQVWEQNRK